MTLRVNGIISPASAAGHVVLSSDLTAGDIRGTRPCSQMPGLCPPHPRKEGHPRRFTVTEQPPLPLACTATGPPRAAKQGSQHGTSSGGDLSRICCRMTARSYSKRLGSR
jgi:hypothetical protein